MQIEFLINEFSKEINKRITIDNLIDTNFINHGYIEKYFLIEYSCKNLFIYL